MICDKVFVLGSPPFLDAVDRLLGFLSVDFDDVFGGSFGLGADEPVSNHRGRTELTILVALFENNLCGEGIHEDDSAGSSLGCSEWEDVAECWRGADSLCFFLLCGWFGDELAEGGPPEEW